MHRVGRFLIAIAALGIGLPAAPMAARHAKVDKQPPVFVNCVSQTLIQGNSISIAADVSIVDVGRFISAATVAIEPGTSLRGGIPADIIGPLRLIAPTSSGFCTEPALASVSGRVIADWVEDRAGSGTVGLSRQQADGAFEAPLYLTCSAGEALEPCRARLRAEVAALP